MPRAVTSCLCAALIGVLASCSLPLVGGPGPDQMLSTALTTLRDTQSYTMTGSLSRLGVSYGIALSTDRQGNLSGEVTDGLFAANVRRLDGKVLLSGTTFMQQFLNMYTGTLWVTGTKDAVSQLVTALDRTALARALSALATGGVSAAPGASSGGSTTTWLAADGISILVADRDPSRPLALMTAPGRSLAGDLSDLVLQVKSYGVPVDRQLDPGVVDLADPNTFPVNDVEVADSLRFESCDGGGCTLTAVVQNNGGRNGTVTVKFTVSRNGQELASCFASAPSLGNKETAKVGCRVNYDRTADVVGGANVQNSVA